MTKLKRVTKKSLEKLYLELRHRIRTIVYKFWKKYGGDFNDLIAEANEHFVTIAVEYGQKDINRGLSLEKKIRNRIWWNLLQTKRRDSRRSKQLPRTELHDNLPTRKESSFDLIDFLITLSDRAKFLVQLIVHPTLEFQRLLDKIKNPSSKDVRMTLKLYLGMIGWSPAKITNVFKEVRTNLSTYSEDK